MLRATQAMLLALLLLAGALCGVACWAILAVVSGEQKLAAEAAAAAQEATVTIAKIGVAADDADTLIRATGPQVKVSLLRADVALGYLDSATAELGDTAVELHKATAELNAPCAPGPCGTLADVNRTLGSMRLASGQVTAVSLHEQAQLDDVNAQESAIATRTQDDLAKLGTAIDGVAALANNKDLKGSLAHLNTTTDAVSAMATDTAQAWHNTLHPKWPRRIWNGIAGVGISVAKFFVP